MRLGLVSDTHDALGLARSARRFFDEARVERILHLGDVMGDETAAVFDGAVILRGNNDPARRGVREWRADLDGVSVGAHHGHETWRGEEVDLLLHGHTHRRRAERVGRTLVVNPGALHRAPLKTIAVVTLPSLEVAFHEVREDRVVPLA